MRGALQFARKLAVAGMATVAAELAVAVLWRAPAQQDFDASGTFGADGLELLRVAAVGDSTLTAPGVMSPDDIWARVVARRISAHTGRPVELRSFGTGGATAADLVRHQLDAALAFEPHVAMVSIGANDVMRGVRMRRLEQDLDHIVSALTHIGAKVVLSGVGDLGSIPRLAPPLRQMVSRLGRRADRVHDLVAERHGAIKADQWSWAAHQFRSRSDVWSADFFHPNAAGHCIWAEVCWKAIEPILDLVTPGGVPTRS